MAEESVGKALNDAKVSYKDVQQAFVGYVYGQHFLSFQNSKRNSLDWFFFAPGDSTCGQRALYQMGLTGIPIFNVNNNCATGSSALHMANQVVAGGLSDCVLAVGFEKMQRGSLGSGVRFSLQLYFIFYKDHFKLLVV